MQLELMFIIFGALYLDTPIF